MNPVQLQTTETGIFFAAEEIPENRNVKISKVMLELFERAMTTLQRLGSSERVFGRHSRTEFEKQSAKESSQQKFQGCISFVNILSCVGAAPEDARKAIGVIAASCGEIAKGYIVTTQSSKSLHQQALSETRENRSTLLSFIDKFLSALQEMIRSEKNSG